MGLTPNELERVCVHSNEGDVLSSATTWPIDETLFQQFLGDS